MKKILTLLFILTNFFVFGQSKKTGYEILETELFRCSKKTIKICENQMVKNSQGEYNWTEVCGKFKTTQLKINGVKSSYELIEALNVSYDSLFVSENNRLPDFRKYRIQGRFFETSHYLVGDTVAVFVVAVGKDLIIGTPKRFFLIRGDFGLTLPKLFYELLDLPEEPEYEVKIPGIILGKISGTP